MAEEKFDFYFTRGDNIYLKFAFKDNTGTPIDITSWYCKFTLRDPITDLPIVTQQKVHNDNIVGGGGIYFLNDTTPGIPPGLDISSTNQCIVYIPYAESAGLTYDIYKFDLEFTVNGLLSKQTALHGNLILLKEHTPSV